MNILATNHTSFTVSNLDRSIAFFRDALGFKVTSKAPRAPAVIEKVTGIPGAQVMIAYVRGPGHSIELIEYSDPKDRVVVRPRPCDTGFSHIAYDVENLDAVLAAAARHQVLPVAEIVTVDQGPNKGGRVVYLRDADGITFEFIQKP